MYNRQTTFLLKTHERVNFLWLFVFESDEWNKINRERERKTIPIIKSLLLNANKTNIAHGRGSACFSSFITYFFSSPNLVIFLHFSFTFYFDPWAIDAHRIFCICFVNSFIAFGSLRSLNITNGRYIRHFKRTILSCGRSSKVQKPKSALKR